MFAPIRSGRIYFGNRYAEQNARCVRQALDAYGKTPQDFSDIRRIPDFNPEPLEIGNDLKRNRSVPDSIDELLKKFLLGRAHVNVNA